MIGVKSKYGFGSVVFSDETLRRIFAAAPPEPFALAVSGGSDSTAMMHLTERWCTLHARPAASVTVLTVDHGLRPGSAAEAEAVGRAARALGFAHATLSWQGDAGAAGLQPAAREARYRLMAAHCRANRLVALMTGHTLDDQAETFLLRLARGSGVDGLSAMQPATDLDGVTLLRPLLGLSRARLRAYLRAQGIAWIEDPGNENTAFERIRIRRAQKTLRKIGITATALSQSASRLSRARRALEAQADAAFAAQAALRPEGYAVMPLAAFLALPEEVRVRVLARMLAIIGGASPAPRLARVERLADTLASGARVVTLGGCVIERASGDICVFREPGRMANAPLDLQPAQGVLWDERFFIRLDAKAEGGVSVRPLGEDGWRVIARDPSATHITAPRLAALTTPALWSGTRLLCAPLFGFVAPDVAQSARHVSVTFLPHPSRKVKQM